MRKEEYLSEEKYQKNKSKIKIVALIVLLLGLCLGGSLIYLGITKQKDIDSQYSEESKKALQNDLNEEKINLQAKVNELNSKGITPSSNYQNGEAYDLYILTKVLDPGFDYCAFDEYQDNALTTKYCTLKNDLENLDNDFNKRFASTQNLPIYIFGGFVIFATLIVSGSIYMFAKRREFTAFTIQQVMPVAQEGMEKMAPSAGKVAKEIAKGIKDGIKDENS